MFRTTSTILFAVIAICACRAKQQVIEMQPLHFTADRSMNGVVVELLDPEVLFVEGVSAFEEKRYEDAVRKFSMILKHFAQSRFAKPAQYNLGMSLNKLNKCMEAAHAFATFIENNPTDPDIPDAWLKLGQSYQECGEWEKAKQAFLKRLTLEPLTLLAEIETRARLARCYRMLGLYRESQEEARRVIGLHSKHITLPEVNGNYFAAMASMEEAETFRDLFCKIKFVLPVERMEKDLLDKATLFLKAQAGYMRTIRMHNNYWSVIAGIRIGRLYEDFYQDIIDAEIPPELTPEEVRIYQEELKRQVKPLLAKAILAYERNLNVVKMYGGSEEWIGDTKERLERLRKLFDEKE